jgi:hypothetical protein
VRTDSRRQRDKPIPDMSAKQDPHRWGHMVPTTLTMNDDAKIDAQMPNSLLSHTRKTSN